MKKLERVLAYGLHCAIGCACVFSFSPPALADNFFAGKQITLVVGSEPGGGYDAFARLLARHWSQYIPGHPTIVIQNMPGAGSLATMNYIANVAPKDGLTVGAVQDTIGYEPMMGLSGGKENDHFDLLKMNWLGSMSKEVSIPVLWNPPPVRTLQEAIDTKKKITTGAPGFSTPNSIYAHLMNAVLNTNFDIVQGYGSQSAIWLAMENGELQGSGAPFYSSLLASKPDWIHDKKVTILVQIALEKDPNLPDVPLILDFLKTQDQMQEMRLAVAALAMGRPFVLADGAPADRVKILRDSFMAAVKDPQLLREAQTARLEINPIDGDAVRHILVDMYNTPQPIIDRVRAIFSPKK